MAVMIRYASFHFPGKQISQNPSIAQVCQIRKWTQIAKAMGYDIKNGPTIAGQLKLAFIKIIQPFEEYRERLTVNGTPNVLTPSSSLGGDCKTPATPVDTQYRQKESPTASPVTLEKVQAASEKLNQALNTSPLPSDYAKRECHEYNNSDRGTSASSPGNINGLLGSPVPSRRLAPGEASYTDFSIHIIVLMTLSRYAKSVKWIKMM